MKKCPRCGGKLERDGFCNYCNTYFSDEEIESAALAGNSPYGDAIQKIRQRDAKFKIFLAIFLPLLFATALILNFVLLKEDEMKFVALVGLIPGLPGILLCVVSKERLETLKEGMSGLAVLFFAVFLLFGWIVIVKNPSQIVMRALGVFFAMTGFLFAVLPMAVNYILL